MNYVFSVTRTRVGNENTRIAVGPQCTMSIKALKEHRVSFPSAPCQSKHRKNTECRSLVHHVNQSTERTPSVVP